MKAKENLLLLSEEGILHSNNEPHTNVPVQNVSVVAGNVYQDQVAVIVDKHEVWTFVSGKWHQVVSTDIRLNCIWWTSEKRLLVGTETARLAWLSNGTLKFIDSFAKAIHLSRSETDDLRILTELFLVDFDRWHIASQ